jgi:hypothetical protein
MKWLTKTERESFEFILKLIKQNEELRTEIKHLKSELETARTWQRLETEARQMGDKVENG